MMIPRNYLFIVFFLISLVSERLVALPMTWQYTGSVWHYGMKVGAYSSQETLHYQLNRFHSDLKVTWGRDITVHTIVDVDNYWLDHALSTSYLDGIHFVSTHLPMQVYYQWMSSETHMMSVYLHRIYATFHFKQGDLMYGLQRFPLGVGKLWRPVDVVHSYHPFNLVSMERMGVVGLSYTHSLSSLSQWQLLISQTKDGSIYHKGGRIQWHLYETDMAGSYVRNDSLEMVGIDMVGSWGNSGVGTYIEWAFIQSYEHNRSYSHGVLGIDALVKDPFIMTLEAYYNGLGDSRLSQYRFDETAYGWTPLAKYYLGMIVYYEYSPLIIVSCQSIYNMNDGSILMSPTVNRSFYEDWEGVIGGAIPYGQSGSEFDRYPYHLFVSIGTYF